MVYVSRANQLWCRSSALIRTSRSVNSTIVGIYSMIITHTLSNPQRIVGYQYCCVQSLGHKLLSQNLTGQFTAVGLIISSRKHRSLMAINGSGRAAI